MPAIYLRHPGGIGNAMLLLHGFGADRLTWSATQPALSGVADVWTLDLPGHGQASIDVGDATLDSLAGAVASGLDAEGLAAVDIVSHSLGGAVAVRLAEIRPDLVRSLAMIAPVGLGTALDMVFLTEFPVVTDPTAAEALLRRLVSRPRLINRMMVSYVMAELERPGRRQALARFAAAMTEIVAAARQSFDRIAETDLPRLVIWGEEDRIHGLDRDRLDAFGGNVLILPATGHMPHVESAVTVNRVLTAFAAALAD
jgi:pimeloyl-ACP methyl ester carboxylesterase